jgi:hypothetical protein
LARMSALCSSSPALTPRIKAWLKNNCRLIEFIGPERAPTASYQKVDRQVVLSTSQ